MFKLISVTTESELAQFKDLLLEYAGKDLANAQQSTIWSDIAQLPGRYAPPQGCMLLAFRQGVLAGCGAMAPTALAGVVEVKRIYVRPDHRRMGLARQLTQALCERAASASYHTAGISTWPHNTQAIALYRQLGFGSLPPFKEHPYTELVFLGLRLDAHAA